MDKANIGHLIIALLGGYVIILKTALTNYKKEMKELKKVVYEIRDDVIILKTRREHEE